ncbi:MAG: glycosyl hydrolase family 95 catalytic domain-containing protein [Blautia wexlerae]
MAGWVSHHNLDIWGHSSPVGQFGQDENPCTYSMWPMSSGWLCCHLWEHYCYTLDEAFFKKEGISDYTRGRRILPGLSGTL